MQLHDARVLLVEDEALINMNTTEMLKDLGCNVHSFCELDAARADAAARRPDLALLNIRIGRDTSYALAEWLDRQRVPIIFVTGYETDDIEPKWRDRPICRKPYDEEDIRAAAAKALAAKGAAAAPHPRPSPPGDYL